MLNLNCVKIVSEANKSRSTDEYVDREQHIKKYIMTMLVQPLLDSAVNKIHLVLPVRIQFSSQRLSKKWHTLFVFLKRRGVTLTYKQIIDEVLVQQSNHSTYYSMCKRYSLKPEILNELYKHYNVVDDASLLKCINEEFQLTDREKIEKKKDEKQHAYHTIYRITNKLTNGYYVGKHSSDIPFLSTNYFGSGRLISEAIKKDGIHNFYREVLVECSTEDEAYFEEEKLVTEEMLADSLCYNQVLGGRCGFLNKTKTAKTFKEFNKRKK